MRDALLLTERGRAQALLEMRLDRRARLVAASGATPFSGTPALVYLVTKDTLLTWMARGDGSLELSRSAVSRDSLGRLVRQMRLDFGVEPDTDAWAPAVQSGAVTRGMAVSAISRNARSDSKAARALAALLLPASLGQTFRNDEEVLIVTSGVLALVPFAALPSLSDNAAMPAHFTMRYSPSLAVAAELDAANATENRTMPQMLNALVVGNPVMPTLAMSTSGGERSRLDSLPWARTEARWVAAKLGVHPLLDAEATESTVSRSMKNASIVHLATHGMAYASELRARDSYVVFAADSAKDGFLTVGELIDHGDLHANLVVLSACQTGLGNIRQGEGVVGLQRAFLAAGARSLLVSLWSVDDQATSLLMQQFYEHWLDDANHPTKAGALRRAQNDVRAMPRYSKPRYWAAFQLVGAK